MTDEDASLRRLWASVLLQALQDATADETAASRAEVLRDKRQARAWITAAAGVTAANFESACLAANVDPVRVRNFIVQYEGPPLTAHRLAKLRNTLNITTTDEILKGENQ